MTRWPLAGPSSKAAIPGLGCTWYPYEVGQRARNEPFPEAYAAREDASQPWPALHAAIRAARKAYQTDGAILDREAVAQAAGAVRQIAL